MSRFETTISDLRHQLAQSQAEVGRLQAALEQSPERAELHRLRMAVNMARSQFQFYADEHAKADKAEKAATNRRFADALQAALAPHDAGGGVGQATGVYVASRASAPGRAQMWRDLRAGGWQIISTWIDEAEPGETADYGDLWTRIEAEIRASLGVVLYATDTDFPLKGAFVEAGMALAMGKRVMVVLDHIELDRFMRPIGSWISHPLVQRVSHLGAAYNMLVAEAAVLALAGAGE